MKIKYVFLATIPSIIQAFQNVPGVSKPLGFFDPLGFSKDKSTIEFKKYQESELKHGRIAMLASLGLLLQNKWHPMFNLNHSNLGDSIYYYQIVASKFPLITPVLLSLIGLVEAKTIQNGWEKDGIFKIANLREDYIVGNLGLNPLELKDEKFDNMRTKELNNGRLAMIATLIIVAQQLYETNYFN